MSEDKSSSCESDSLNLNATENGVSMIIEGDYNEHGIIPAEYYVQSGQGSLRTPHVLHQNTSGLTHCNLLF